MESSCSWWCGENPPPLAEGATFRATRMNLFMELCPRFRDNSGTRDAHHEKGPGVVDGSLNAAEARELDRSFWRLYRDFFDLAEKRRRWSIREDIPWDHCNAGLDPAVADVVESFCAVELYLPDYTSKILPVIRF